MTLGDFRPPLTWRTAAVSEPYTVGDVAPAFRIDAAGNTHLRGRLALTPGTSGTPAFVLPEMYRPETLKRLPVATLPGGTTGRVNVSAAGEVIPITSSGKVTDFFLDLTFASAGAMSAEAEEPMPEDDLATEPTDVLDEMGRNLDTLAAVLAAQGTPAPTDELGLLDQIAALSARLDALEDRAA